MIVTNDIIKEATLQVQSNLGNMLALDAGDRRSYPGSGTTWFDLSGNNNNATLFGSPTFSQGYYFAFTGENTKYAKVNHDSTLNIKGKIMTIEYWAFANTGAQTYTPIMKSGTSWPLSINYALLVFAPTEVNNFVFANYTVDTASGNYLYSDTATNGFDGTWAQYVVVINGDTAKFYRNGNLFSTLGGYPVLELVPNTYDLTIGKRPTFNDMALDGGLSIMNLFDYALSDNDVKNNYNFYRTRFGL